MCVCIYIYIYIYTHLELQHCLIRTKTPLKPVKDETKIVEWTESIELI